MRLAKQRNHAEEFRAKADSAEHQSSGRRNTSDAPSPSADTHHPAIRDTN
jgi:hypothetical protein